MKAGEEIGSLHTPERHGRLPTDLAVMGRGVPLHLRVRWREGLVPKGRKRSGPRDSPARRETPLPQAVEGRPLR
jgi:hypothetical protein